MYFYFSSHNSEHNVYKEPNDSILSVVDLICHLHRLIFLFVSVTRLQSTAATLYGTRNTNKDMLQSKNGNKGTQSVFLVYYSRCEEHRKGEYVQRRRRGSGKKINNKKNK